METASSLFPYRNYRTGSVETLHDLDQSIQVRDFASGNSEKPATCHQKIFSSGTQLKHFFGPRDRNEWPCGISYVLSLSFLWKNRPDQDSYPTRLDTPSGLEPTPPPPPMLICVLFFFLVALSLQDFHQEGAGRHTTVFAGGFAVR